MTILLFSFVDECIIRCIHSYNCSNFEHYCDNPLKTLDEFPDSQPFTLFLGVSCQLTPGEVTVESGGTSEDYIRFLSCPLFGPVNHGQNWKSWARSVEKACLSVIIKMKLA